MGFSYRYHARTDTLFVRGSGVLTSDEFVAGITRLRADTGKAVPFGCRRFGDFAAVDVFDVSQPVLDQLFGATWNPPPGRHAILMFRPLGASAFEEFLQRLLDQNCRFFTDRQRALDWLNEGIPSEMIVTSLESRM
jgi:hypothetical protein